MTPARLLVARRAASRSSASRNTTRWLTPRASRSSSTVRQRLEVARRRARRRRPPRARPSSPRATNSSTSAADHLRRQVVDAEVARVLEHVHRRRLAGAREARDDDEVLEAARRAAGVASTSRVVGGWRGVVRRDAAPPGRYRSSPSGRRDRPSLAAIGDRRSRRRFTRTAWSHCLHAVPGAQLAGQPGG